MKPVKEDFEINETEGVVKCFQTWDFLSREKLHRH